MLLRSKKLLLRHSLKGDPQAEDDPMLAVDAAALAQDNKILPELSDALYMKSVKFILLTVGESDKVASFFYNNSSEITSELNEIIDEVKKKIQIETSCRNCHRSRTPQDCLNLQQVTPLVW